MAIFDRGKAGNPTANANARNTLRREAPGARLVGVAPTPMPMTSRLATPEGDGYHYHWAAANEVRLDYLINTLGYEIVPAAEGGDPKSIDGARRTAGTILLRCTEETYRARKDYLHNVVNPRHVAGPRENFKEVARRAGSEEVEVFDRSRTKVGPFSSVANEPVGIEPNIGED